MGVGIITGGGSGIGLGLANVFGQRGMTIVLADSDGDALDKAQASLWEAGIDAHAQVVDVCEPATLARAADTAAGLGPLEVVCCNAGVSSPGTTVWETSQETFDFVFGVNFGGLLNSLREFVPRLVEAGRPATVVVTASMAGLVAVPMSGAYGASKAAAVAIAKAVRSELSTAAPGVDVVLCAPGMVKTNLGRTSAAQRRNNEVSAEAVEATHTALNEYGVEPAEVARWVIEAIDARRFWAVPPASDRFSTMLAAELDELKTAIG